MGGGGGGGGVGGGGVGLCWGSALGDFGSEGVSGSWEGRRLGWPRRKRSADRKGVVLGVVGH